LYHGLSRSQANNYQSVDLLSDVPSLTEAENEIICLDAADVNRGDTVWLARAIPTRGVVLKHKRQWDGKIERAYVKLVSGRTVMVDVSHLFDDHVSAEHCFNVSR
jgi:putative N-acetylmannosamine-6-phosphate epimerase